MILQGKRVNFVTPFPGGNSNKYSTSQARNCAATSIAPAQRNHEVLLWVQIQKYCSLRACYGNHLRSDRLAAEIWQYGQNLEMMQWLDF
jgi:hypothetical protein